LKKKIFNNDPLRIIILYFATAYFFVVAAHIYIIWNPELILAGPVTGGLIAWIHIHTMGVITPLFMAIGYYNLQRNYNSGIKVYHVLLQYILLFLSLTVFLFHIYFRQGSMALSISAGMLFSSGAYYIFIYASVLRRLKKEKRNFEFWIDVVSLYFFFQAILFGFVLALNLSYHFLRTSELHSLKLHSHSGIAGFWFLQFINMICRNSMLETVLHNVRYLKYSAACMSLGLFLWTSVHDHFPVVLYFFYFLAGLSLLFLFSYLKKSDSKKIFSLVLLRLNLVLMLLAYGLAGIMIFSGSEGFIYGNHVPFIYAYIIFYGIFISAPIPFLKKLYAERERYTPVEFQNMERGYFLYIIFSVALVLSILWENIVYLQVFVAILLLIVGFIYYKVIKKCKNLIV